MKVVYQTDNKVETNFNTILIYNKNLICIEKGMNKIDLLKIDIPKFYEGFLVSCLTKLNLIFPSGQGTIDWDYKKDVAIFFWSTKVLKIESNTLIAKIILRPIHPLEGQTAGSVGKDLVLLEDVILKEGEIKDLPLEDTPNIPGHIRSRSGLALQGLRVFGSLNRKNPVLKAQNLFGDKHLKKGQRVAQLVVPSSYSSVMSVESMVEYGWENGLLKVIITKNPLLKSEEEKFEYSVDFISIVDHYDFRIINPVLINFEPIYIMAGVNERPIGSAFFAGLNIPIEDYGFFDLQTIVEPRFYINWIKGNVEESERGGFGSTGL